MTRQRKPAAIAWESKVFSVICRVTLYCSTAGGLPKLDSTKATCGQHASIGGEADEPDARPISLECFHKVAVADVPECGGFILLAAGGDESPVRREGIGVARRSKRPNLFAASRIPKRDVAVLSLGGD